jgi:hypothetical protein
MYKDELQYSFINDYIVYTVEIVYICVFMTCSTSHCLCDELMHQLDGRTDGWTDRQIDRYCAYVFCGTCELT